MAEVEISLEYSGPNVEDGAMAIEDLVPVLQGFAGAYGKISASRGITTQHKLRLVAIRHGSAKLVLDVWEAVGQNSASIKVIGELAAVAMSVVSSIIA